MRKSKGGTNDLDSPDQSAVCRFTTSSTSPYGHLISCRSFFENAAWFTAGRDMFRFQLSQRISTLVRSLGATFDLER